MIFAYFVHDGMYWRGPFWKPLANSVAIEISDRCRHTVWSNEDVGAAVRHLLDGRVPPHKIRHALDEVLDGALVLNLSIVDVAYRVSNAILAA